MGYSSQQDYTVKTIRTAAILTTSYVAGTVLGPTELVEANNQLNLYIAFTIGSLTDAQVKIEFSDDNTTWYQETAASYSTGVFTDAVAVHKYTASGNYRISIPIKDRYVKISSIGTGTVTSSSLGIKAVLGVA
jgi:hypothetical protein